MEKVYIIKVEKEYGEITKEVIKEEFSKYSNLDVELYETSEVSIIFK